MSTKQSASLSPVVSIDKMNIGLDANYRAAISQDLSSILAATYRLTIKSHIYHWNVVGPVFKPLHELLEEHYNALFGAVDIVAERIRAMGHLAPVKLGKTESFAPSHESIDHKTAEEMVADLITDHEDAVRAMRKAASKADEHDDMVTADMLTDRLTFHEKALWMLRAIIAG